MMAAEMMLARRQIRLAALAALTGEQFAAVTIESPGDWNTAPEDLPAILLRAPDDRKESIGKGAPQFTSTCTIEIEARVGELTDTAAQDSIEALCLAIEMALLTNIDLIRIINQVVSVESRTEISSDGKLHFGGARMLFAFEVPEMFDSFGAPGAPPGAPLSGLPIPLYGLGLHLDAGAPFDATGNYPDARFPAAPAPRTAGPDGRDEGALNIVLPQ